MIYEFVAVYQYSSKRPGRLCIEVGEVITVLDNIDEGMLYCQLTSYYSTDCMGGLFHYNYDALWRIADSYSFYIAC